MFSVEEITVCDICDRSSIVSKPAYVKQLGLERVGCGIKECLNCGHVFLSPRPELGLLNEFYSTNEDVFGLGGTEFKAGIHASALVHDNNLDNSAKRLELIRRFCPSGTLLDVGAGRGRFVSFATAAGYASIGIEPGEPNRGYASEHDDIQLIAAGIDDYEPEVAFDVVHSSHVLEHVWSPTEMMKKLYEWTAPAGICAIEVPNQLNNVFAVRDRLLRRNNQSDPGVRDLIHLSFFDKKTLRDLCCRTGFEVVAERSWYRPGSRVTFLRLTHWITRGLGNIVLGGPNLFVIARKPDDG